MVPFTARQLFTLFAATMVPRVLLAAYLGVAGAPERWEYDVIARNIANGGGHVYDRLGFVYAAYAPPLWSYVLAVLLHLPGSAGAGIQIAQSLLCFGSAVIYGAFAQRIAGDGRVGLLAGLIVALQPSLLYYSVVKSDPLCANVLLLGLIALIGTSLVSRPSTSLAACFGLLVGASVLSRGTPIVALPIVALALLVRRRRDALGAVAVAMLSVAVPVAPWLARNFVVLGTPLITSTTGENLWRGNHEGAGGGVKDLDGGAITRLTPSNPDLPENIRAVLLNGSEALRHETFMNEALRFVAERPGEAIRLFAAKLRTFWWRIDSDPRDYSPVASLAYEMIYRSELALALFGVFTVFRHPRTGPRAPNLMAAGVAIAIIVAISLLQSAFYVQGRHRFMIEPLLLTFTACGALALFRNRAATTPLS